jgi:DNA repair exonuclease SbcCD nuclease subunit
LHLPRRKRNPDPSGKKMSIDLVVTADNHLNYYSQKMGSKISERRSRIGRAWRETIDYAIENRVDLYLNAGDLFDQISPRNPPRARVVEAFRELKDEGIPAFILAGNHEAPASTRDGGSPHSILHEAGLARVFENTKSFEQGIMDINGRRVSLAGLSFDKKLGSGDDPLAGSRIPGGGDFNIAMLHYSIEKLAPPIWEEPQIKLSSLEENSHIHLFAMGHIHEHIRYPLGDSVILYPGSTEHYNFGEVGNKTGFCHVTIDDGIEVEFIETNSQSMKQLKLHTSELSPEPTRYVLKILEEEQDEDCLLQLVLEGDIPFEEYIKIDFTRLNDFGKSSNFYFELDDRTRPLIEGLELPRTERLHPREELRAMIKRVIDEAGSEDKKIWERAGEMAAGYYDRCWEVR